MKETLLLRLFFAFYQLLWFCVTPLLIRSRRIKEGAAERMLQEINFGKVDIWIHAASAGEAYLARQIVKNLGLETGRILDILITTNTSQGREILEKRPGFGEHRVSVAYLVFDKPSLIKKAVGIADPDLLVLVELEIWPALMAEMKRCGKKVVIINGRMTERSFRGYKKAAAIWRQLQPDTILAISEPDKKRFVELFHQPRTYHVPNIKFDRMEKCQIWDDGKKDTQFLILASVRKEESAEIIYLVVELLKRYPELNIGLFPRHMHWLDHWGALLSEENISWKLQSDKIVEQSCSVVLWDIFGELKQMYRKADAVFVGGSLAPLGGQNFIEVFMNGVVPITGPSISDFLWTGPEVLSDGLIRKGESKEEVLSLLIDSLENPMDKLILQQKADSYIAKKQGGSRITCEYIESLL